MIPPHFIAKHEIDLTKKPQATFFSPWLPAPPMPSGRCQICGCRSLHEIEVVRCGCGFLWWKFWFLVQAPVQLHRMATDPKWGDWGWGWHILEWGGGLRWELIKKIDRRQVWCWSVFFLHLLEIKPTRCTTPENDSLTAAGRRGSHVQSQQGAE